MMKDIQFIWKNVDMSSSTNYRIRIEFILQICFRVDGVTIILDPSLVKRPFLVENTKGRKGIPKDIPTPMLFPVSTRLTHLCPCQNDTSDQVDLYSVPILIEGIERKMVEIPCTKMQLPTATALKSA